MFSEKLNAAFNVDQYTWAQWISICDALASEFNAVGALLLPLDKDSRSPWLINSASLDKIADIYIKDAWYKRDIRERGLPYLRSNGYTTDLDFITIEEMNKTPYYKDFLKPNGIGGFLAFSFMVKDEEWIASIQFPTGVYEFEPEKIALIPKIQNCLEQAANNTLNKIEKRWKYFIEDLTTIKQGIVLFGHDANISLNTDFSNQLLFKHKIKLNQNNKLKLQIKQTLKNIPTGISDEAFISKLSENHEVDLIYSINIVPDDLRVFNPSAAIMIILAEAKSTTAKINELLANDYELTKTEVRITQKLIDGLKLKEIAVELQISEGNARQHLKKIFRKANVESQLQLVVKILHDCSLLNVR